MLEVPKRSHAAKFNISRKNNPCFDFFFVPNNQTIDWNIVNFQFN